MTLLSRTADNLYWFGRYLERAENNARLLDIAYRMSQMPDSNLAPQAEWNAVLLIAGQDEAFAERFKALSARKVIEYMAFDDKNLSSIKNCLRFARENARAERNTIPSEIFESINATWLAMKGFDGKQVAASGYRDFFDWVKDRVQSLRGLTYGVMLQTEAFQFNRLGNYLERGDNTARLVDVKFRVLNADGAEDKAADYYRWGALLRSLSAFKSYRTVYHDTIKPKKVAELILLNPAFPRSLSHCTAQVTDVLKQLAPEARSTAMAMRLQSRFSKKRIEDITRGRSLTATLEGFTASNAQLSDQIARDFLLTA